MTKTITSTITRYALTQSVAAHNKTTNAAVQVPVQVKFEVQTGNKVQRITFGYSRLGGRGMYMTVNGGAPKKMTKEAFVKMLNNNSLRGANVIKGKLRAIQSLHTDVFVVGTCECCKTNHVTAANMDFMQRNSQKLSAQLKRDLTPFSKVCYECQGRKQVNQPNVAAEPVAVYKAESKEGVATCAACAKGIQSKRVAEYSLSQFGQALCFGKCQNDAKKARAARVTTLTCQTCNRESDTLHLSGNCEDCWADAAASEASLPYSGQAASPSPEQSQDLGGAALAEERPCGDCGIEASLTDAGRCIGCALEHDAAMELSEEAEEAVEVDTTDLNAILDADGQVDDFMNGVALPVGDELPESLQ